MVAACDYRDFRAPPLLTSRRGHLHAPSRSSAIIARNIDVEPVAGDLRRGGDEALADCAAVARHQRAMASASWPRGAPAAKLGRHKCP